MKRTSGFTVIELVSTLVLVFVVVTLILIQKNNLDASGRDQDRKTATNAIYYGLKEVYYVQNKSYPVGVDSKKLPYIDPKSFVQIGDDSKYKLHYSGLDCSGSSCKNFELKINLEKEATYKKTSI